MSKIKKIWQKYKQFLLFCLVGVANTLVAIGVNWLVLALLKYIGLSIVVFGASLAAGISSLAGDVAGAINSYILNSKFVFDGRNKHTGYKFIAAFFIYAILSALLVMLLNQMGVTEEYCKVIVTPIMIIENYFINKFWVFKNDKR